MQKIVIILTSIFIFTMINYCDINEQLVNPQTSDVVLFINEISAKGDPDWLEIYNPGSADLDIGGYFIYDDDSKSDKTVFPQRTIVPAKGYLLWYCDDVQTNFKLSADGETVILEDSEGRQIDAVTFPVLEDGQSYGRTEDGGELWEIFSTPTPEKSNAVNDASELVLFINEIFSTGDPDWLEIYNPLDTEVDLGGFYIYDDGTASDKSVFPAGTVISAGGFLLWHCDDVQTKFKLSSGGETVTLEDSAGNQIDRVSFPATEKGTTYGRVTDGAAEWKIFRNPTPGKSNSGPAVNRPPQISGVTISPQDIDSSTVITIYAEVNDPDDNLRSFTITYGAPDELNHTRNMVALVKGYQAQIGPFANGSVIGFYLTAIDDSAAVTVTDLQKIEIGVQSPVLFINEFMASNDFCCTDENGDYDDWIEIYNPGPDSVDIGGWYISDDLADVTAWQIPASNPELTAIAPQDYLLLWADKESEQGILHVDIKLSADGEAIALAAPSGAVIDQIVFEEQQTDISFGRLPDGGTDWESFMNPTPGSANSN